MAKEMITRDSFGTRVVNNVKYKRIVSCLEYKRIVSCFRNLRNIITLEPKGQRLQSKVMESYCNYVEREREMAKERMTPDSLVLGLLSKVR